MIFKQRMERLRMLSILFLDLVYLYTVYNRSVHNIWYSMHHSQCTDCSLSDQCSIWWSFQWFTVWITECIPVQNQLCRWITRSLVVVVVVTVQELFWQRTFFLIQFCFCSAWQTKTSGKWAIYFTFVSAANSSVHTMYTCTDIL